MSALTHNIGAELLPKFAGAGTAVAAGAGDNTKVNGADVNHAGKLSGVLVITYKAVLAQAATLSFAVEHEDSPEGSTRDTAVADQAATVAATGGTGGSTETGVVKFNVDFATTKNYRRYM